MGMLKTLKMMAGTKVLSGGRCGLARETLAVVDVGSVRRSLAEGGRLMSWKQRLQTGSVAALSSCLGSGEYGRTTASLPGKREADSTFSRKAEKQRRLYSWERGFQSVLDGGRG